MDLWRYMDVSKFISLLSTRRLWFSRLDQLGDPFEGSIPRRLLPTFGVADVLADLFEGDVDVPSVRDRVIRDSNAAREARRHGAFVSCWHQNAHESAAMWKLYLKSDEGLAIRTTREALISALPVAEHAIEIHRVEYLDFDADAPPQSERRWWLLKRKSFEHEREVRAVLINDKARNHLGIAVPLAAPIDRLVLAVHVAPSTPEFFREAVQSICDAFGLKTTVQRSKIDDDPIY